MMSTRIIVADDHPLFRDAISQLLQRTLPGITIDQVESLGALSQRLQQSPLPSLVLLDLKLDDTQGMDGLLLLKKQYPSLPVLIISAFDDSHVIRMAMQYGSSGFVSKGQDMERMAEAIHAVLDGDIWFPDLGETEQSEYSAHAGIDALTPSQLRVLTLLREGMPSKEMAATMSVTEATIKAHLTEIFRKLGVRNRTQAVLATKDLDLPQPDLL